MTGGTQLKGDELLKRQQQYKASSGPEVICDGIQTPQNFGSILRVADAMGCLSIRLLDSDLDLRNKKLSRLARSTDKHLDIQHQTLSSFLQQRQQYSHLYALEITSNSYNLAQTDISHCDGIVIGHESQGIRPALLECCDMAVHLPMYGKNGSMNVSHALAIFLYQWRCQ